MKKSAFSYLELIICMTVVVTAIMLSTPFLTGKGSSGKNSDIYGEFRCFSEYDESSGTYKLYQQQRYNTHTLSAKKDVTDEGCTFSKPVGAGSYTITLSGGGGGGASASINENNSNYNQITEIGSTVSINPLNRSNAAGLPNGASYYLPSSNCTSTYCEFKHPETGFQALVDRYAVKRMQRIIKVYPGGGGSAGETISKTTSLVNNFDSNDSLHIKFCKNAHISSESTEEAYCVGKGGRGGKGNSLSSHYSVVAIMQDLVRAHKYPSLPYTGLGDGQIDNYDKMNLAMAVKDTASNKPNSLMSTYLSSRTSANYTNLYYALNQVLSMQSANRIQDDSDGYDGEYTRFAISNTENLIAYGGKGARTSQNTENLYYNNTAANHAYNYNSGFHHFIRKGGNGGFDAKMQANGGAQGGYCQCSGTACTNCDGNNGKYIGVGGGGGSIVFKTAQDLGTYDVTSFYLKGTDQELGSEYDIGDIPTKDHLNLALQEDEIFPETYYTGKGGNGGGGAIIINW